MELEKIYYAWLPNIHRYEQKFMGIPMMTFMAGGVSGIILFAIVSQSIGNVGGMVVGTLVAIIGFGLTILATTKLGAFYNMALPIYLIKRWQARQDPAIHLPLIIGHTKTPVVVEDWEGAEEAVIE